jgi:ribose/xylose/arabinose/galactoside ABC-type transport system permease subunit
LSLLIVIAISSNVSGTFWAILVTQKLGIPAEHISFFPLVRAVIMLMMFFLITPRINRDRFHNPMLVGFFGLIASQCILITMSPQNYGLLILTAVLEAGSIALVNPLVDSLVFFTVEAQERARMVAILYVVVFIFTSPFGWVAGILSAKAKTYPFILTLVLYAIGLGLTWLTYHLSKKEKENQTA